MERHANLMNMVEITMEWDSDGAFVRVSGTTIPMSCPRCAEAVEVDVDHRCGNRVLKMPATKSKRGVSRPKGF